MNLKSISLKGLQEHPSLQLLRNALAVCGIAIVGFLLYQNGSTLVHAVSDSPLLFLTGLGIGCVSLLIQATGFRTAPKMATVPRIEVANIWCSAIVFNHIFPLAGGLGYRFVAFKVKGIGVKTTGRATLWFLGTSAATSSVSLVLLFLTARTNPAVAVLLCLGVLVGAFFGLQTLHVGEHSFVAPMVVYQVAQVLFMGLVVLYGARLVELDLSLTQAAALGCVMRLGSLISLTPAGLGIQEAIIIGVLSRYGVTSEDSAATAVMVRILYLISAILLAVGSRLLLHLQTAPTAPQTSDPSS